MSDLETGQLVLLSLDGLVLWIACGIVFSIARLRRVGVLKGLSSPLTNTLGFLVMGPLAFDVGLEDLRHMRCRSCGEDVERGTVCWISRHRHGSKPRR